MEKSDTKKSSKIWKCEDKDCRNQVGLIDKLNDKGWCIDHKPPLSYVFK